MISIIQGLHIIIIDGTELTLLKLVTCKTRRYENEA
jgi:hypothetical protein